MKSSLGSSGKEKDLSRSSWADGKHAILDKAVVMVMIADSL